MEVKYMSLKLVSVYTGERVLLFISAVGDGGGSRDNYTNGVHERQGKWCGCSTKMYYISW